MTPLFLFRPEPGWSVTAQQARETGLDVRGTPLFAVEPVEWDLPAHLAFDGLLAGSANVFRHGGENLGHLRHLVVHAVGQATAEAARLAGFEVARTGQGGLQGMLDTLAGQALSLLRLAGEERVELAQPSGISITTRVVYRTVPVELDEGTIAQMRGGGVALLHSAAAVARLEAQCAAHGIAFSGLDLVVIGPRVAEVCRAGWKSIHIAAAPRDADMLALANSLCQN